MDKEKDNETPGPKDAATQEHVGTAGTTEDQDELTAAEKEFIHADARVGEGDQDGPPPVADYEYGMGSGRPADEEGKGVFFGSSSAGAQHDSKFGKLLKEAKHLIHGRGRERTKSGSGSGIGIGIGSGSGNGK